MSESIWQHPRTGTNHNHDRGCEVAITKLKRQTRQSSFHHQMSCGSESFFINHTHKVGKNVSF